MRVRAKFRCNSKTHTAQGDHHTCHVELTPVYEGMADGTSGNACEENKIFGEHTPSGEIKMTMIGEAASPGHGAASRFEPGKCYYVDFTPADVGDAE